MVEVCGSWILVTGFLRQIRVEGGKDKGTSRKCQPSVNVTPTQTWEVGKKQWRLTNTGSRFVNISLISHNFLLCRRIISLK